MPSPCAFTSNCFSRFGLPICSVCMGDPQNPLCLPCEHVYCVACIKQWLVPGQMFCPLCIHPIDEDFLMVPSDTIRWVAACGLNHSFSLLFLLSLLSSNPKLFTSMCVSFCVGFTSNNTLSSGSSAMLSSLTWCPLCASRTTLPLVQPSFSICCPSSWWRPTLFPF